MHVQTYLKQTPPRRVAAFTLIELLVVIAVIALLASMIIPITGAAKKARDKAKVRAELMRVVLAIEAYKARSGVYPPDHPANVFINPLYYELAGTRLENGVYTTLDGSASLPAANVSTYFGVGGFGNAMQGASGGDEGAVARNYIKEFKPDAVGDAGNGVKLLVCSVGWPENLGPVAPGLPTRLNPFRYRSTNPTNNPGGFELWVDVLVGGKTNRFSNWTREPIVVGTLN